MLARRLHFLAVAGPVEGGPQYIAPALQEGFAVLYSMLYGTLYHMVLHAVAYLFFHTHTEGVCYVTKGRDDVC